MRIPRARLRLAGLGAACAVLLLSAGPASAATTVFPAGGSAFASNAEGWSAGAVSCAPVGLLCTPEAVHESGTGNPGGAIAAKTTVTLNLLNLFTGTVVWNSPQFTVPAGAVTGAGVRLERAFEPGGLVNVGPKATYTVTLRNLTTATSATPLSEQVTAEEPFLARSAPASVVGGHTYQLSISSSTAQSTLSLALLSGTAALRFDNVGLVVQTPGGGGGGGGGGGNGGGGGGGSQDRLAELIGSSLINPAILKGKRLFVKVRCPATIGANCRIALQGLLNRKTAATRARNVRVGVGKTKRVVIKVKPRARPRLAARKRLLFRETVRAGGAKATVFKNLKLIRR